MTASTAILLPHRGQAITSKAAHFDQHRPGRRDKDLRSEHQLGHRRDHTAHIGRVKELGEMKPGGTAFVRAFQAGSPASVWTISSGPAESRGFPSSRKSSPIPRITGALEAVTGVGRSLEGLPLDPELVLVGAPGAPCRWSPLSVYSSVAERIACTAIRVRRAS